ncbi:hypothetical protein BDV34DRAFT_216221 [Aspergillus parasiticus]|uniref:Uncharacterized protein n=1 Tax=Aspergillus parasiticus TaxID=5067 RepID=A0A5N6D8R8_ASPPA|nr:hypothetical protein BDV34DRAFT_216221 [Aspergillus parasiticus]
MDPEVLDILTRFKDLKSASARRALYHLLLEQMHPYEWRDIYQKSTFSEESPDDGIVFYPLGYSAMLCASNAFTQYAKQRVRLERGQPISKVLDRPYSPIPNATGLVGLDFSHGSYGWIEDAIVYVHNLHSNMTQSFCTDNRDTFTALRISESIVAAITLHGSRFCYVWSIQTNDSAYFRLPSLNWKYFVARGMNVAMAFNGITASGPDSIIHWQLDCRVTHTFNTANKIAYLDVDPTSSTLITVHLERTVDPDTLMHVRCCPVMTPLPFGPHLAPWH